MIFMKALEHSVELISCLPATGVKHRNSILFVEFEIVTDVELNVWDSGRSELGSDLTYKTDNSTYRRCK